MENGPKWTQNNGRRRSKELGVGRRLNTFDYIFDIIRYVRSKKLLLKVIQTSSQRPTGGTRHKTQDTLRPTR